jgi:hypothetical protein
VLPVLDQSPFAESWQAISSFIAQVQLVSLARAGMVNKECKRGRFSHGKSTMSGISMHLTRTRTGSPVTKPRRLVCDAHKALNALHSTSVKNNISKSGDAKI